jgi:chemotaxis protein MotA
MDPTTLLGIGTALGALLLTMLLEGSNPTAILLLPPLVLVFGATIGAAMAGSTMADMRQVGRWLRMALTPAVLPTMEQRIATLVDLAGKARREGLLALDREVTTIQDPFLRRGLQLAVDGVAPEHLQAVMEGEIAARTSDERVAARFFLRMGGYAPTIGIIGTVVGLIHVLATLDQSKTIGPLIASAFVATLWGVLSANVFWLPMSARITRTSQLRNAQLQLLLTGITEIHAGASPRALRQRLTSLLPPSETANGRAA